MIHLDATFKLNTLDYPSFGLSTSDVNRVSHVCVTAIASQRTQVDRRYYLVSAKAAIYRDPDNTPSTLYDGKCIMH